METSQMPDFLRLPPSTQKNKKGQLKGPPYTLYYPHTSPGKLWNEQWWQVVSIDPGTVNYTLRIERRYKDGRVLTLVFDKVPVKTIISVEGITIFHTLQAITEFLDKHQKFFEESHFVVVEKQLIYSSPKSKVPAVNPKAVIISQHTISYFSLRLHNFPLRPFIVEVDSKLKYKQLECPKGFTKKQRKDWGIVKARQILEKRGDNWALGVMDFFKSKQDDLADTTSQTEALFIFWRINSPNH